MKKIVKLVVAGLTSIALSVSFTPMKTATVNAASTTNSSLKNDTQQHVSNHRDLTLTGSEFSLDPMNTDTANEPDFDSMSVKELNQYIDEKVQQEANLNSRKAKSIYVAAQATVTTSVLKNMWKAAGEIAKKVGYPCAGTMIQYSASGKNYTEWSQGGGLFASRIKKTSAYKKAKKRKAKSIEFTKEDSKDLFYALHLVSSDFNYTKKHPVHVHDVYDFKFMASYKNSPFTSAINNWGYLCSHMNVLYPSKINIYF
ncbi:hypothetical protein VST03_09025 [Lactobacillus delbrueckii subsp. allosunkii]|uniref:hypothetical protein n=1 Tax=Lactobacillus delbrueckii TaxID=1584 RepID=UPI003A86D99C